MNENEKSKFIEKSCKLSVELIYLISKLMKISANIEKGNDENSIDILVSDLKVIPTFEETEQYSQIGLWNKIQRRNTNCFNMAEKFINKKQVFFYNFFFKLFFQI